MENTCCGFGHRKIYGNIPKLRTAIEELCEIGITEYLTGGMGDFDRIFATAVKKSGGKLILVIPYMTAELNRNKDYYDSFYDEIIIPQSVEGMFPKRAIKERNLWMIENSSIIIGHITKPYGGAADAMAYAEKTGKTTIYI